jgi:hypothetical protein
MPRPKVRPENRQRAVRACLPCKSSKKRCNSLMPCSSCIRRDCVSQCVYDGAGDLRASRRSRTDRLSPGITISSAAHDGGIGRAIEVLQLHPHHHTDHLAGVGSSGNNNNNNNDKDVAEFTAPPVVPNTPQSTLPPASESGAASSSVGGVGSPDKAPVRATGVGMPKARMMMNSKGQKGESRFCCGRVGRAVDWYI